MLISHRMIVMTELTMYIGYYCYVMLINWYRNNLHSPTNRRWSRLDMQFL